VKCFLVRTSTGLAAGDAQAAEVLNAIKLGEVVRVDTVKERNVKQHRLFWVMCHALGEALGQPTKVVADALKLRTGHFTEVQTLDGELLRIPDSIAFNAMDQIAFNAFFNECCREVCAAWLPHMTPGKWRKDILQMMGIDWDDSNSDTPARH
jgi:hypothetical protein